MRGPIQEQMEEWLAQGLPFPDAMIGGDSIFQSYHPWLVTPYSIAEAATDGRKRIFNKKFCACRDTVERYIGVLKERFPILFGDPAVKGLKFKDITDSMKVIQVCVALHNFIVKNQDTVERRNDEDELLQNLADVRFPRPRVADPNGPVAPDGRVATHDYLLSKYIAHFRPIPH